MRLKTCRCEVLGTTYDVPVAAVTAVTLMGVMALTGALVARSAPAGQGGSISGVVVSIDTPPQPVRRAIVSVSGADIPSNLSVVADDEGRFVFPDLRPGRYTVRASKAAHLAATYGASRPGEPGTAVAVTAGRQADLRIVLPRGAVIAGTVRDHLGQPAAGVRVTIAPSGELSGASGYRSSTGVLLTDDRGVYRAYGLAPGEYVASAVPRVTGSGEIFMMTAADIDARLRALQQQTGVPAPGAPGGVTTTAPRAQDLAPVTDEPAYGYAPTFFPGTTIAANAGRLTVAAGEVREGVDIPLLPARAARVEGTIVSGEVDVTRIRPAMTPLGPSQPTFQSPRLTGPAADGSFSFSGVTPGRYILLARTGPGALMTVSGARGSATTNNPDVASLFAMQELSIDGADVTGVTLTLGPALSLSGRIEFDATTLTPPEKLAGVRVSLTRAGAATPTVVNGIGLGLPPPPAAAAQPDGSFTMTGILPGTYGLASGVPGGGTATTGWWLRSAIVNGRDVLDHLLEVGGTTSNMSGAVLTFTDRRNELAGTLSTATGAPASEFIVVVYAADESYWRPGARRLRSTRPASDGAFSVVGLPAGDYLIAALTDIDPDAWQHPDFLRQLVPASVQVAIRDGEVTRQDLRISR